MNMTKFMKKLLTLVLTLVLVQTTIRIAQSAEDVVDPDLPLPDPDFMSEFLPSIQGDKPPSACPPRDSSCPSPVGTVSPKNTGSTTTTTASTPTKADLFIQEQVKTILSSSNPAGEMQSHDSKEVLMFGRDRSNFQWNSKGKGKILAAMDAKAAGAILATMTPAQAAEITNTMAADTVAKILATMSNTAPTNSSTPDSILAAMGKDQANAVANAIGKIYADKTTDSTIQTAINTAVTNTAGTDWKWTTPPSTDMYQKLIANLEAASKPVATAASTAPTTPTTSASTPSTTPSESSTPSNGTTTTTSTPTPTASTSTTETVPVDVISEVVAKIQANPDKAAEITAAAVRENPDVAAEITAAAVKENPYMVLKIVAGTVKANPDKAAEITAAAVKAEPNQATWITVAAVSANPDKAAEITAAAVSANPDVAAEITAAAVEENPDKAEDITAAVVKANPAKVSEIVAGAVSANPDKAADITAAAAKVSDNAEKIAQGRIAGMVLNALKYYVFYHGDDGTEESKVGMYNALNAYMANPTPDNLAAMIKAADGVSTTYGKAKGYRSGDTVTAFVALAKWLREQDATSTPTTTAASTAPTTPTTSASTPSTTPTANNSTTTPTTNAANSVTYIASQITQSSGSPLGSSLENLGGQTMYNNIDTTNNSASGVGGSATPQAVQLPPPSACVGAC